MLGLVGGACENHPDAESSAPGDKRATQFDNLEHLDVPNRCEGGSGVTDSTMSVGGLISKSGEAGPSFARAEDGVRARFELANATDELGGRRVELLVADDAGSAARNLTAARSLVESQDVFGVIEISAGANGSAGYLSRKHIPVTGWHAADPVWGEYPNMFSYNGINPEDQQTTQNAVVFRELGARRIAILSGGTSSSVQLVRDIAETIDADPQLAVVYRNLEVPPGDTEFSEEVQQIIDSDADALYTGMGFVSNTALSEQLKQAGADDLVTILPGGYDPVALAAGGAGFDGAYFGVEFVPFEIETPGFRAFERAMGDLPIGQVPMAGWLSADLFIEGLKAAGIKCPTREAFITNLRLEEGYTADGLLLPIDFSEQFGNQFLCLYYVQVQNEEFVPQFGGEPVCGEPFED